MNFSFGNNAAPAPSGASHSSARAASASIPRGTDSIQPVGDGDPGENWLNALSAWVEAHKYYPREAAANGEDGDVVVRVIVNRSGRVESVELRDSSGSRWLDLGLQAIFRGARLPPLPPRLHRP